MASCRRCRATFLRPRLAALPRAACPTLLLLSVRTQSGNAKLLVHGGVGSARVHFTRGTFENPAEPPMFCMLLRKHLVGARITGISQPDFERMLVLDLDGLDELGTPVKKQLVVRLKLPCHY